MLLTKVKSIYAVIVDDTVELSPDTFNKAEELFKGKPDGIHEIKGWIVKKIGGRVAGLIKFMPHEYKSINDEYDFIPHSNFSRVELINIAKDYRRKGIGKELLLYAIKHHGAVESNMSATPEGDALWKSLKGTPGIEVRYTDGETDFGHLAWTTK